MLDQGDSSPIEIGDSARHLPPERWPELVRERRRWIWSEGYRVLQLLETMAEDGPILAEALGYADAATLLRQGYGLDLALGPQGGRWMRLLRRSPAGQLIERDCLRCGEPFLARRCDARYCSSSCRSKASRERRRRAP